MADDNRVHIFMNTFRLDEDQAKYVLEQTYKTIKSLNEPPTKDKEPSREAIMKLLKDRYKLNDIQSTNVLEYAYGLSEARSKSNDFAIAHYLNNLAIGLFEMVVDHNNLPDTNAVNRSYILISNELKRIYARNPELQAIKESICWQAFDRLEHIEHAFWDWKQYNENEYGISHNAEVNTLCIINGKETPEFSPELKKIVAEAETNGKAFYAELEEEDPEYDGKIIPEYTLTYDNNGIILVNGVLKLKKTQAGQASDMVLSQSFQHDGQTEPFKPSLATKRQLTTIIGDMGFDPTLRAIFFPTISKGRGIIFRSHLTRTEADAQHIDTRKLDKKLKKLGAVTEQEPDRPIDLSEIPFWFEHFLNRK